MAFSLKFSYLGFMFTVTEKALRQGRRNVSEKKMLYLNTETALGNDKGNTVEDLCKRLPGVKRTTNNSETYAELGRVLLGVYRLFNVILAHNSLHK